MYIIEIILLSYFGYVTLYSSILSVAALFYRTPPVPTARRQRHIAVLIPAYKEDSVIVGVARQALQTNYPKSLFDVVVIADSLRPDTLAALKAMPLIVVDVAFDKSTKVKALQRAMQQIGDDYDCALILDADNVMESNFLPKMNDLFDIGHRAVQAARTPKNENTPLALLDGISETVNNFIYRQGNAALGLSSPLIGSGMMFDYALCKNTIAEMDSIGGFDRDLELRMLKQGVNIHYARNIILYDEKVANQQVFEHQRKRWLSSHFVYLRRYFKEGWRQLFRGRFGYFNSAVLRNVQLPRLLNLGLLMLTLVASIALRQYLAIDPWVWALLLAVNVGSILAAIPARLYNITMLKSVFLLPRLFGKMFLLLFQLKGANKTFLHTPHDSAEVSVGDRSG